MFLGLLYEYKCVFVEHMYRLINIYITKIIVLNQKSTIYFRSKYYQLIMNRDIEKNIIVRVVN